jgi:uncharacterized membrane protein
MKKSTKAALLSALVFPGVGNVYLKRYISGAVIAGATVVALYVLISNAVHRALEIVDKLQRGEIQPDMAVISELVSKQPLGTEALLIDIATALLILAWIIGIVDAYRCGRFQDDGADAQWGAK